MPPRSRYECINSPKREDRVYFFGIYLGVDLNKYPHLRDIVETMLDEPAPHGWEECAAPDGDMFYLNRNLGISSWEHPHDRFHRKELKRKIKEHKKANATTCTVQ
jgi:centrosomal protein CEP164